MKALISRETFFWLSYLHGVSVAHDVQFSCESCVACSTVALVLAPNSFLGTDRGQQMRVTCAVSGLGNSVYAAKHYRDI
jgi:hypothetical protein